LTDATIASRFHKEPRAFNSIQEPSVLSWIPPLPRRNYAL
jgi:hypothetical protein